MTTETSEKGLETLIMRHMTGEDGLAVPPNTAAERPLPYGGTGYSAGRAKDYDRAHALDVSQLFAFLHTTQPEAFKKLAFAGASDAKDINRLKFLARLSSEIGKRGVIDVLRKGVEYLHAADRVRSRQGQQRHVVDLQRLGEAVAAVVPEEALGQKGLKRRQHRDPLPGFRTRRHGERNPRVGAIFRLEGEGRRMPPRPK